jgi:hypothetical protein
MMALIGRFVINSQFVAAIAVVGLFIGGAVFIKALVKIGGTRRSIDTITAKSPTRKRSLMSSKHNRLVRNNEPHHTGY